MREVSRIAVSVVCAGPERVFNVDLVLPEGATAADAIAASGIRDAWPGVLIHADRVGIFARKVPLDTLLRDGDRVEIYRTLVIDPKEARRTRSRNNC
jgi:putative ubiquitin-RnfH superfamily antitoxin RatB of RatAB toxin-antitoxin module